MHIPVSFVTSELWLLSSLTILISQHESDQRMELLVFVIYCIIFIYKKNYVEMAIQVEIFRIFLDFVHLLLVNYSIKNKTNCRYKISKPVDKKIFFIFVIDYKYIGTIVFVKNYKFKNNYTTK